MHPDDAMNLSFDELKTRSLYELTGGLIAALSFYLRESEVPSQQRLTRALNRIGRAIGDGHGFEAMDRAYRSARAFYSTEFQLSPIAHVTKAWRGIRTREMRVWGGE